MLHIFKLYNIVIS